MRDPKNPSFAHFIDPILIFHGEAGVFLLLTGYLTYASIQGQMREDLPIFAAGFQPSQIIDAVILSNKQMSGSTSIQGKLKPKEVVKRLRRV